MHQLDSVLSGFFEAYCSAGERAAWTDGWDAAVTVLARHVPVEQVRITISRKTYEIDHGDRRGVAAEQLGRTGPVRPGAYSVSPLHRCPRGHIAWDHRGTEPVHERALRATAEGAVGLLLIEASAEPPRGLSLASDVDIPVLLVGACEIKDSGTVVVGRATREREVPILWYRPPGARTMIGACLEANGRGPGMNHNATGAALATTIVAQRRDMGLVLWGAEDVDLPSTVDVLDVDGWFDGVVCLLELDTLGSRNGGCFLSGGASYLAPALEQELNLSIRSAHPTAAGVAFATAIEWVGTVSSGDHGLKTAEEVELWGGRAGEHHDPAAHTMEDTLENVDRSRLRTMEHIARVLLAKVHRSVERQ